MVDLTATLRAVVLPAVEAVFRDDELSSVEVRVEDGAVRLVVTARGETYTDDVVQAGVPGQSLAGWEERLRSNLVDFVAESRFGWGQDRGATPSG